jgi:dTDP-4-amino-4,6-dideoxygalactose transaminase
MKVPFYRHQLGSEELARVASVFQSDILTTGKEVQEFEAQFSGYLGISHSVGLQSCTAALHLALEAFDFQDGSEVITTPMTFVATALAIRQARLTPVFAPIEEDTGNLDVTRIENYITEKTVAVLPVHLYGQMVDMRKLMSICKKYNLKCIEDAAHCVEGSRDSVRVGMLSDAACFSFYATKNLSCGEGGCLSTNSAELADKIRLLRSHGVDKTAYSRYNEGYKHWRLSDLGWKYNLDNIHASILLPQLTLISKKRSLREYAATYYDRHFSSHVGIELISVRKHIVHARHLYPIKVAPHKRDGLIEHLKSRGIGAMVNYRCLSNYEKILNISRFDRASFVESSRFGDSVLSLPFFPGITKNQQNAVIQAIFDYNL